MAREQLSEPRFNWNGFADRPQLAAALADHVAALLTNAIAQRGTALV
ncbi:6-phosphogluconolactonase, partial [Mesorhizobium sp. M1C.F.Ca.ET.144.01.1.1]